MKRLVIGMTAHVDAGKTTLSEAMLYRSGELRKLGRVDHGDAFLDTHSIEKSRGITVFSKQAVMHLPDGEYTLLDTPGHADFSAETERALSVLDYAVLVISGTDGVQSHTETIWRLLKRYSIPVFVFVNKTDISVFDRTYLLNDLKAHLSGSITDFMSSDRDSFLDELSTLDEDMMNSYLETGDISSELIREAIKKRSVFPCFFGSALKLKGIDELLSGLSEYTLMPQYGNEFGARIYKITSESGTRLTHMKITGGSLRVRTQLADGEKANQLRIYSGAKFTAPEEVFPGTLCAVSGLTNTAAGTGLGTESEVSAPLLEPVLSYRVIVPKETDDHTMLGYMRILEEEDPQLHVICNERLGEIHVRLMGKIQLEILRTVIKERFGLDADFDRGSITYKETIAAPVVGIGHYEPLRHYAEVHLLMEPLPAGSGIIITSSCSEDSLDRNWQRLIMGNLHEKAHLGVLTGAPITDMKITLVAGRASLKHTEGGDFRQASWRAVRMGLRYAESILLEPFYSFTLEVPSASAGRALNDLQQMGAEFGSPEIISDTAVIKGSAPVACMADYHTDIAGYTGGRGRLSCIFKGYYPCHNPDEIIALTGYDADSDLDNTADSVFCAHGAGFGVRWNEVRDYAHLDSGIAFGEKKEEPQKTEPRRYTPSYADDDELMAIFERTYGKIDRSPRSAMRREYEHYESRKKPSPVPSGPVYLLVDGYNMIFSWDELKKIAADNLDLARSRLITTLCNYRGFRKCEVILVFDAYRVKGEHREVEQIDGISVVYTKEAETADMYIEKTTHELARNYRVRVATSDGAEQMIILGNGAYRVTANELYEEIRAAESAIRNIIESRSFTGRNTGGIRVKNEE